MDEIKTERLTLRPVLERDKAALTALLANEEIGRTYMVPELDSEEKKAALFARIRELSEAPDRFVYCICLNGSPIGMINDVGIDGGEVELGYFIDPAHKNRGYASEALAAAIGRLFGMGYSKVKAAAFHENAASLRVMQKCGMLPTGETETVSYRGAEHVCVCYEIKNERQFDMHDKLIENATAYIKELFKTNSGGHDAEHTLRVYHNAMLIAQEEPGCDMTVVALAALLHDADDYKLFNTQLNANARAFLAENNVPANTAEAVIEAVNSVSFSKNRGRAPETIEGKIVQDADRLDAIGAVGVARTFAYGGEHGRSLSGSVQHFYDKLLLLKDMMNTPAAGKLAEKRHAFLEAFLKELEEETGV